MEKENNLFLDIVNSDKKNIELIIDVGCNFGDFVIECSNRWGRDIRLLAFEPDIENCEVVRNRCSDLVNLNLQQKAVFYSNNRSSKVYGVGDMNRGGYMVADIDTEHVNRNMFPNLHEYVGKTFELTTLEEYCESAWLIKLDCEASEWNILQHSKVVSNTKHVIVEIHNHDIGYFMNFAKQHMKNHRVEAATARHVYMRKNK